MDSVQLKHQVKQLLALGSWRKDRLLLPVNGSRGLWLKPCALGGHRQSPGSCLPVQHCGSQVPHLAGPRGAQGVDNNLPVLPEVLAQLLHPMGCSATAWEEGGQSGRAALLERVAGSEQLQRS